MTPNATSRQAEVTSLGTLPLYERAVPDKAVLEILPISRATLWKLKANGTIPSRVVAVGANGPIRRTSIEAARRYLASINGGIQ